LLKKQQHVRIQIVQKNDTGSIALLDGTGCRTGLEGLEFIG
jgi:hypothetical protein